MTRLDDKVAVVIGGASGIGLAIAHRFTAKVAWLTVGSGLTFGLSFAVIHQVPHEAKLWPLVFARFAATAVVMVAAVATRNFALPTGLPRKLALVDVRVDYSEPKSSTGG